MIEAKTLTQKKISIFEKQNTEDLYCRLIETYGFKNKEEFQTELGIPKKYDCHGVTDNYYEQAGDYLIFASEITITVVILTFVALAKIFNKHM